MGKTSRQIHQRREAEPSRNQQTSERDVALPDCHGHRCASCGFGGRTVITRVRLSVKTAPCLEIVQLRARRHRVIRLFICSFTDKHAVCVRWTQCWWAIPGDDEIGSANQTTCQRPPCDVLASISVQSPTDAGQRGAGRPEPARDEHRPTTDRRTDGRTDGRVDCWRPRNCSLLSTDGLTPTTDSTRPTDRQFDRPAANAS